MVVLGCLPKFKRGLGLAFGAHFLIFSAILFFLSKISNKMSYEVLI